MCICWVAVFISPTLGYSESWKPFFVAIWLLGIVASIAGIIYFFVARKTWDVVACLTISLFGIALSIIAIFVSSAASAVG
jgi:hypothetical protein